MKQLLFLFTLLLSYSLTGAEAPLGNPEANQKLFTACMTGNLKLAKKAFSEGAHVHAIYQTPEQSSPLNGYTPLHLACEHGFKNLVVYLLEERRSDPEVGPDEAFPNRPHPLHLLIKKSKTPNSKAVLSIIKQFILLTNQYNEDDDSFLYTNLEGKTPLCYAVSLGLTKTVRTLLEATIVSIDPENIEELSLDFLNARADAKILENQEIISILERWPAQVRGAYLRRRRVREYWKKKRVRERRGPHPEHFIFNTLEEWDYRATAEKALQQVEAKTTDSLPGDNKPQGGRTKRKLSQSKEKRKKS